MLFGSVQASEEIANHRADLSVLANTTGQARLCACPFHQAQLCKARMSEVASTLLNREISEYGELTENTTIHFHCHHAFCDADASFKPLITALPFAEGSGIDIRPDSTIVSCKPIRFCTCM